MATPVDRLISALDALMQPNRTAAVRALLQRGALGDALTEQLDTLLDGIGATVGLLVKPLRDLANAQGPESPLHESTARALILAGKPKVAISVLGERRTTRAQDLWALAMNRRVKRATQEPVARALLDEMWRDRARFPTNDYVSETLLSTTLTWVARAAVGNDHSAIVERATRALTIPCRDILQGRLWIDLYGRLALAHRMLGNYEAGVAAAAAVIPLRSHAKSPRDLNNFTWAMAEGAYQAVALLDRATAGRAFVAALRAAFGKRLSADDKIELAYGIVMEARAEFLDGDHSKATELLAEAAALAPDDPYAASAATLLRGDLARAAGDRDAARTHYTLVIERNGASTDDSFGDDVRRARERLATL